MRRILWFRRDLRIDDNPLLSQEGEVLPIFIFDSNILSSLQVDDRRITFIFNALMTLKSSLQKRGLNLAIFYGEPSEVFRYLLADHSFDDVCASGDYDAYALERDRDISHLLPFNYLHDTYIFRADEVLKNDGTPYLVFTPYYNRIRTLFTPEHYHKYLPVKQHLVAFEYTSLIHIHSSHKTLKPLTLNSIGFIPQTLTPQQLRSPHDKLKHFASKIEYYSLKRDFMALDATSTLGVDLRFGTISIRAILRWLLTQKKHAIDTEPFFRELIFREFYAMLLAHFPHLNKQNFRYLFTGVPNEEYYTLFCKGQTGVPIVDAGIAELLNSGEMHNRVRMIVASFFTKNLLLPWQWGEAFFAQHLNDYDTASNILSWQWSAGTGVDPQPYFRIFNPYTQTAKFDAHAVYIYKWLPQLTDIEPKKLYNENILKELSINRYPHPIVNQKISSRNALAYYKSIQT